MEKEPTREELIEQCIKWKLRDPFHIKLFIGKKEVVLQKELGMRLNPDAYSLPRIY